jgi:hypothetical protein
LYQNINGYDVNVILLEDALGVPGSVWHNTDDSYTIFIDSKLCKERQQQVYLHELKHILGNDFNKNNVNIIECIAHGNIV